MSPGAGGEPAGMSISPDDPTRVVAADGKVFPLWAPVVEVFLAGGVWYARTRKPGATREVLIAVDRDPRKPAPWRAYVRTSATIAVDGDTLSAGTLVRAFPGRIRDVVAFDDGAYAVAWEHGASGERVGRLPRCSITVVDAAGGERWTREAGEVVDVTRIDDPLVRDALVVRTSSSGGVVHPWDGRTVLSWEER